MSLYREASEAPLRSSLRYYMKAVSLLALVATFAFAVFSVPQGVRFMKEEALPLIAEKYPANLEVTIKNGEASSSTASSTVIAGEKKILNTLFGNEVVENILVIDTERDYERGAFDAYHTFALLAKHDLVVRGGEGRVTVQSLRNVPDMTISTTTLTSFVKMVNGTLPIFVVISLVVVFVLLFLGYVIYLIPLALFALIPLFLAWTKHFPFTYRGAYKMSVYAVIPGLALKTLFNVGGVLFVPAYFSLLIFVLVIFLVMKKLA